MFTDVRFHAANGNMMLKKTLIPLLLRYVDRIVIIQCKMQVTDLISDDFSGIWFVIEQFMPALLTQ